MCGAGRPLACYSSVATARCHSAGHAYVYRTRAVQRSCRGQGSAAAVPQPSRRASTTPRRKTATRSRALCAMGMGCYTSHSSCGYPYMQQHRQQTNKKHSKQQRRLSSKAAATTGVVTSRSAVTTEQVPMACNTTLLLPLLLFVKAYILSAMDAF